jgi:hypothetical protein
MGVKSLKVIKGTTVSRKDYAVDSERGNITQSFLMLESSHGILLCFREIFRFVTKL